MTDDSKRAHGVADTEPAGGGERPVSLPADSQPISYREFVRQHEESLALDAKKAFAQHVLRRNDPDHWVIQRRYDDGAWNSTYATSIVCVEPRTLVVTGDIDLVAFAYGPPDPRARLAWMGRHAKVDAYVSEKARIGLTDGGKLVEVYDEDAAQVWLDDEIREATEDRDDEGLTRDKRIEGLREALDLVENQHELLEHLYALDMDSDRLGSIGMVVTPRLVYAHAALVRACELLDAKDAQ